jgi:hypothetical protein
MELAWFPGPEPVFALRESALLVFLDFTNVKKVTTHCSLGESMNNEEPQMQDIQICVS